MPAPWSLTLPYFLLFGLVCGAGGFRVGWRLPGRIGLPLAQGLLGWVAFLVAWTILGPRGAAATVGAWALGTALTSLDAFVRAPREADARVLRAAPYRSEMLSWIEMRRGPESVPGATALRHLRELIWYLAAAALTANLGSIVMGAILLNYMNAYVATLLRAATRPVRVVVLGWNVWSVVRVAAYVVLGAAASGPLLARCGLPADRDALRGLWIAGGIGVAADYALKLALSRAAAGALAGAVDLEAAKANRSSEAPLSLDLS